MNVKRYEWVSCDEHACHCDVVESAEGDMVDYEDYAALEARCAALAAENAELKEDRDTLARYWIEDGGDEDCAMSYCEPIPSTDAFLAEVRASAIEHAAAERWGSGYVFDELNEFADQLRKGVQS
ncbi:hypothetical protein LWT92_10795 [Enterobacter hormaechei]|nr:hypothetical protein [Enterobacter hormaechei]MCE1537224.1 hypothetical protein [Enterobacter hormaechei]MCE1554867.1 hypothetical protein [Enterobacter hormaechei]